MMYRLRRWYRAQGRTLHVLVVAVLLALTVLAANAYSESVVGAKTNLLISAHEHAQLAVETFALQLEPELVLAGEPGSGGIDADGAGVDGAVANSADIDSADLDSADLDSAGVDSDGPPGEAAATAFDVAAAAPGRILACGTVTNNTGEPVWNVTAALIAMDRIPDFDGERPELTGRITVADSTLAPGASETLTCDFTGLAPGVYEWTGRVTARWQGGSAEVSFVVSAVIPEPEVVAALAGGDTDEEETITDESNDSGVDETAEQDGDDAAGRTGSAATDGDSPAASAVDSGSADEDDTAAGGVAGPEGETP